MATKAKVKDLSYKRCEELFDPSNKKIQAVKLDNNTYLYKEPLGPTEDYYTVQFHRTAILRFLPSGLVILAHGGFMSSTTKERLSRLSPYAVSQQKGVWYIGDTEFFDGTAWLSHPDWTKTDPYSADNGPAPEPIQKLCDWGFYHAANQYALAVQRKPELATDPVALEMVSRGDVGVLMDYLSDNT